jgi:hypothetical protein
VGTNGILDCNFLSENAHRTLVGGGPAAEFQKLLQSLVSLQCLDAIYSVDW